VGGGKCTFCGSLVNTVTVVPENDNVICKTPRFDFSKIKMYATSYICGIYFNL